MSSAEETVQTDYSLSRTDEAKATQVDHKEEEFGTSIALAAANEQEESKTKLSAAQIFDIEYNEHADVHKGFPRKLFIVLGKEEYSDILSWLPHGRGFIVKDRERLTDVILPKHFKKAKFPAFARKLNRWNFTRIVSGPERGAYYNPFFQRDNRRLSNQMSCNTGKRPKVTQAFNPVSLGMAAPMTTPFPQQPIPIQPMPQNFLTPAQAFFFNQMFWMQQQQQQLPPQSSVITSMLPMPSSTLPLQQPPLPKLSSPPGPLPTYPDVTDTSPKVQRTQQESLGSSLDDRQDNDTIASMFTSGGESAKESSSGVDEITADSLL